LLVVDDDASVRESYHLILDDEFTIVEAAEGEAAITTVRTQCVDLVILDVLMPGVDGIEILQQLKALEPDLAVIMVTAMRTVRSAVTSMRLGALDYLTKPFDEEELLATIRRALDRRARTRLAHADGECQDRNAHQSQPHRILLVGGDLGWRAVLAVTLQQFGLVELADTLPAGLDRALKLLPTCLVLRSDSSPEAATRVLRTVHARQPACISFVVGPDVIRDTIQDGELLHIGRVIVSPLELGEMVHRIADALGATARREVRRLRLSSIVSRTLDYVGHHYADSLTIQYLARTVGTSTSRLSHLFVAETGMTVMDYVLRVRVAIAQELLAHTTQKVTHIATNVGFFDASHLARGFHKVTGRPPSVYRRSAS
jgi:YesN/AraC family two-component response regulator